MIRHFVLLFRKCVDHLCVMVLSLSGIAFSDEIENTKVCIGAFLTLGWWKIHMYGYSIWSYYQLNLFILLLSKWYQARVKGGATGTQPGARKDKGPAKIYIIKFIWTKKWPDFKCIQASKIPEKTKCLLL